MDRPERQHAWNETLGIDEFGHAPPEHHVLLALRLTTEADESDREQVETAFASLERSYEHSPDGLLFAVGYSTAYF